MSVEWIDELTPDGQGHDALEALARRSVEAVVRCDGFAWPYLITVVLTDDPQLRIPPADLRDQIDLILPSGHSHTAVVVQLAERQIDAGELLCVRLREASASYITNDLILHLLSPLFRSRSAYQKNTSAIRPISPYLLFSIQNFL